MTLDRYQTKQQFELTTVAQTDTLNEDFSFKDLNADALLRQAADLLNVNQRPHTTLEEGHWTITPRCNQTRERHQYRETTSLTLQKEIARSRNERKDRYRLQINLRMDKGAFVVFYEVVYSVFVDIKLKSHSNNT
ncbi:hypothetical protein DPMN_008783 [Dreissena polymorpha]|uniref:Uncharacterized protein n=1 Tax=Dreissena polymorpha TaxID=45954 RepID=A0A9D4MYS9_DREPO|nr:hypothetical protein DPMN_008783 [Dreissena polymorpha]